MKGSKWSYKENASVCNNSSSFLPSFEDIKDLQTYNYCFTQYVKNPLKNSYSLTFWKHVILAQWFSKRSLNTALTACINANSWCQDQTLNQKLWGCSSAIYAFNKPFRWFQCTIKFEKHWSTATTELRKGKAMGAKEM